MSALKQKASLFYEFVLAMPYYTQTCQTYNIPNIYMSQESLIIFYTDKSSGLTLYPKLFGYNVNQYHSLTFKCGCRSTQLLNKLQL